MPNCKGGPNRPFSAQGDGIDVAAEVERIASGEGASDAFLQVRRETFRQTSKSDKEYYGKDNFEFHFSLIHNF